MYSDNPRPTHDPAAQSPAHGAAYWLATLSDESCTDGERQQFSEWLRASARNIEEFLKLSTLVRTANRRAELWPDHSVASLIAEAKASSNVAALKSRITPSNTLIQRRVLPWVMAASIALVALGAALIVSDGRWTSWPSATYQTVVGEQRSITLDDGSIVELNSRSQLRTRFTRNLRAVELIEGEAIFRVSKDADRPFRVRTGATDIVVVGTAFNVNADRSRTIVTVLEGRVRVDRRASTAGAPGADPANAAPIELAVGEQLTVAHARPVVRVSLPDTEKVTSWTQRRLIFDETSIAAAAAEFARYSPRQIRIDDAGIAARTITGVFDATDPAALVEFLRADETVAVVAERDGWVVRASGSSEVTR